MKRLVTVTAAAALMTVVNPTTPSPVTFAAKLVKQAKGVAQVQARCESLAYTVHADLGYEKWYIEEAMVYQASECLSSAITDWFDQCENYCTSCNKARDCETSGNEECMWNEGACHFGESVAATSSLVLTLQVAAGATETLTLPKFTAHSKWQTHDMAAQQILDWMFDRWIDVWAVLVVPSGVTETNGVVKIAATVYYTNALQAKAYQSVYMDVMRIAVEKWNEAHETISGRRRLAAAPPLVLKLEGTIATAPVLECGNADCAECGNTAAECEIHSDCKLKDDGTACEYKDCTGSTCGDCSADYSYAQCTGKASCEWDGSVTCGPCNSWRHTECQSKESCKKEDGYWLSGTTCAEPCGINACTSCITDLTCVAVKCEWTGDDDSGTCAEPCGSSACASCDTEATCVAATCSYSNPGGAGTCAQP